jgi:hypothetical protein
VRKETRFLALARAKIWLIARAFSRAGVILGQKTWFLIIRKIRCEKAQRSGLRHFDSANVATCALWTRRPALIVAHRALFYRDRVAGGTVRVQRMHAFRQRHYPGRCFDEIARVKR